MASKQTQEIVKVSADNYPALTLDPAELAGAFAANLGGEKLGYNDITRIKVPAGGGLAWNVKLADGGKDSPKTIEGVIVHTELARAFWESELGNGNGAKANTPPDCTGKADPETGNFHGTLTRGEIYARARKIYDATKNETIKRVTLAGAGNKQRPAALQACDSCPFAAFGSGKNGGQMCKQKRAIYLVNEDSLLPAALLVPPGSLPNAKKYLLGLSTTPVMEGGRRIILQATDVITRFSLETAKNAGQIEYSQIRFEVVEPLPPEQRAAMREYAKKIAPLLASLTARITTDDTEAKPGQDWEDSDEGDLDNTPGVEILDLDDSDLPTPED